MVATTVVKQNMEQQWARQFGLALTVSVGLVAPSFAQDSEQKRGHSNELEETFVTASKRSESLEDIASAVSAFTSQAIEQRGLNRVDDLVGLVPNLQVSEQTGASLITIRGAGLTVDTGYAEPGVAIYADGIYQPRTAVGLIGAADVERIEVLRGPQGTLYGRNATGGVVNFISKGPTDEFEAEIAAGFGNLDAYNGRVMVSGPITDNINARIVAATNSRGDYLDNLETGNEVGEREESGIRAIVEFLPSDDLSIVLRGHYQETETAPYAVMVTPPVPLDLAILGAANGRPVEYTFDRDAHYEERDVEPGEIKNEGASIEVLWTPNDLNVRFIAGYLENSTFFDVPNDALSVPFIELVRSDVSESVSAELNVSGEMGSVDWLVGAYYFQEDYDASLGFRFASFEVIPGLPGFNIDNNGLEDNESIGIFADATLNISDDLRVFGGLRYSRDEKSMEQTNISLLGPAPFTVVLDGCTFGPVIEPLSFNDTTDNVSPRVGVQYDVNDNANIYAQYQKGYKAGGWNFTGPCGDDFDEEEIDAFEVGYKTNLLDGTLNLFLTAFYYDYTNLQVFTSRVSTAFVVNAPEAEVYGLELESRMRVNDVISLDFMATVMRARYREFVDSDIVTGITWDLDGEPLARSPDYTVGGGIQADIPLDWSLFGGLMLRAEATYTDEIAYRPYASEDIEPGYWNVNAYIELFDMDNKYSVRGYVRNVTDDDHLTQIFGGGVITAGYRKGTVALPRTFGAEVTIRF